MSVMALSQKKIKKAKVWLIGIIFLLVMAAVAYTFLYLKHDAAMTDVGNRLASPSGEHPMGTDHLGRDVLTRLMLGFRLTVGYSVLALGAAVIIGVPFGLLAGLKKGWIDRIFMRVADGFLAFPDTVIAIVLSGLLGPGIGNLLFAIVLVKWVNYARMVRSTVLTEVQKDYITIARINGLSTVSIMRKHLLPHIVGNVLVLASLDFGKIILLISSLSYIGLGAQPPTPEWGAMLNESRPYFQMNPEMMVYPGLAIVVVVLAANVLGDYLRDKFDVKKEVQP
ncbi:nickel ABC transporter permease subunit NikC [Terribacillus saccharophilus]|uniref:nickel transporter permease n=1 Tax=Terribacillus saccharophilus TaxID=361277 RepID=UPI000BA76FD6|nr:nickel transporter permease [Terribacillus saccharophilus]PAF17268.1 nickel ABC transporter permease subunit NikC [Terribacillus saccharophilus]PAF20572.1 nickel ABC transporter permease subunit NikC [Terribacillus saccharophilus]PAF35466.1 nickel ABC transporter permease subunit NikC [Terribacillus saccharophilus]PAF40302.1 nickel ABC transporter permease subunit NikC [Terribacillus saccharophilus]